MSPTPTARALHPALSLEGEMQCCSGLAVQKLNEFKAAQVLRTMP